LSVSATVPGNPGPPTVGVLTLDRLLIVRTWSSWLESATGLAGAEVLGRPLIDVVPDLEARGLLAAFHRVLETGEAHVLASTFHHYLIPCPPASPSPYFAHMQQLVTLGALREENAVRGVLVTIEDVTSRLDGERTLAAELRSVDPAVRQRAADRVAAADTLSAPDAFRDVLRDGNWQARRSAVRGLTRHAPRDLLASLISALRDEHHDFNVLSSALQLLSTADLDITTPLAELLHDESPDVRIQAALALGEHAGTAAAAALMGALDDPEVNVRFQAIESLGRLRASEAVGRLVAIAESRDFFLAFAAIDALVRIADPRVGARLLPLLEDDVLAAPVIDALGSLGGGEVVRPLTRALGRAGAPIHSILKALATVYTTFETRYGGGAYIIGEFREALSPHGTRQILEAIPGATTDELRALVLVLGWAPGPEGSGALARLLGDAEVRSQVIEALVQQGAPVVDVLIDQLSAGDEEVRLAAVTALGGIRDPRATAPLCELLGGRRALAIAAAAAVASIGDPRAFEPLLALLGHEDAAVRQAVIGALHAIGHPEMEHRVQALLGSADTATRESAIRIAGYFGYSESEDAVLHACGDREESVRRAALEHAPLLSERRALPLLLHAISTDTARARACAATALGRVRGVEARGALHQALGDTDAWVRYFAARALAAHADVASLAPLAVAAADDPAPHVRIAAIETIGVIGGPPAADLLAPHTNHADAEIAVAALGALGRVSEAAAMLPLERALRSQDPRRREAAVRALTTRGGSESVAALQWTAGADTNDAVAASAFDGMAQLAARAGQVGADATDALVDLMADPARREIAVATLARVPAGHLDRVVLGLQHEAPAVRRATVDVLTRVKHTEAAAHVRAALDHDDPAVRDAAVTALDRVGARGLPAKLAAMASNDPDVTVRRAAGAVLARLSDTEAGGGTLG
jgi:HEAT repeat protein